MYIGYSEEQEQLRRELRAYYDKLLTPEVEEGLARGHGIGPVNREVVRQMGEDGWLGIGWPKEYGGQGRSAIEQFIFFDESMRAGAPVPMLTINTVGPTIMDFGTDEQKAEFLPRILKGEVHFCIGYTEPGAGTDLAALTTKAVRDGDEYIINGQKMFTSLAGGADYCWLAVRTDPEAKKHKGISMFIVPEWVQVHLARIHARLEFLRLANWKVAWDATQKRLDVADASTIKVFGTEFYLEAFRLMFEVIGQPGYLKQDAPDSVLKSRLERYYRSLIILTFGGGVNEVQRDLIAVSALGMPMAKR